MYVYELKYIASSKVVIYAAFSFEIEHGYCLRVHVLSRFPLLNPPRRVYLGVIPCITQVSTHQILSFGFQAHCENILFAFVDLSDLGLS